MITTENGGIVSNVATKDSHPDCRALLIQIVALQARCLPSMTCRNTLFAGHDDGARSWAWFANLIDTCRLNNVNPHHYDYLLVLYTKLANGHLKKDIDALMPWTYVAKIS